MILRDVLSSDEVAQLLAFAKSSPTMEGAATALGAARSVKQNQHLNLDAKQQQMLFQKVVSALRRHPLFFRAALPKMLTAMAINRYSAGMTYGFHYDLHLQHSIEGAPVRADLSATLFLNAPTDYEGGELQIVAPDGHTQSVKEKAGDMVLYPAGTLHQVSPVTRGERYAVIFWVQSMIRDHELRSLLFSCDDIIDRLQKKLPNSDEVRDLTGLSVNLGRLWMEP